MSESCPISLEHFNENDIVRQLLHCGHLFHQPQFEEWFNSNTRCPVCRYDIRTNNTPSTVTTVAEPETNSTVLLELISNLNGLNNTHVSFDITDEQFANNIIDRFTTNTFLSSSLNQTRRQGDR